MGGFLATLLITMMYVSDASLLVKGYTWLKQLVFFGAVLYGMLQLRQTSIQASNINDLAKTKDVDTTHDFVSFAELLSAGFKIYFIAFFITFLYIFVLFNYIDPTLVELVKDASVKVAIEYKDPSVTEEIFQQQITQLREQDFSPRLTDFFSIMSMFELIMGFMFSFIVALFLQREQPKYK